MSNEIEELKFFHHLLIEAPRELPDDVNETIAWFEDAIFIIKRLQKRFRH